VSSWLLRVFGNRTPTCSAWAVTAREGTRPLLALLALLALTACTALDPKPVVQEPTTVRPVASQYKAPANGAIFQADGPYHPLFEDQRARNVGDTLVITINEKLAASQKSSSSANRDGSSSVDIPVVHGLPGKFLQGAELSAKTGNKFEGKGETAKDNVFTGIITVTVIEVLANGNLRVAGDKQIGINKNVEVLRFSGVVSPATILQGNTVSSTQVADARIDHRGAGYISEAQTMGWLQRFFMNVLPF
jgi:flagellar L-ring protein FlgH